MKRMIWLLSVAFLLPIHLHGQVQPELQPQVFGTEVRGLLITRAELVAELELQRDILEANLNVKTVRERAAENVAYIEARLEAGDFQPGDLIGLLVEGEQDVFPDTVVVEAGPALLLPNVGTISLKGVLRSELQDYVTRELSRFLRDPVVRVRPTIRVTFQGQVGRPGFYSFPAAMPIGDAIMAAGGPTGAARMGSIKIKRGGKVLFSGNEVDDFIAQGRSFDQLGFKPGDEVNIPERLFTTPRLVGMAVSAVAVLILGIRLSGGGFR
jgi:protein involved in polysaccharide export with SLBB domain